MDSEPAGRKNLASILLILTILFGVASITSFAVGRIFTSGSKAAIRAAKSVDQIGAVMASREARVGRRLNTMSNVLFVLFVALLVATVVVKRRS